MMSIDVSCGTDGQDPDGQDPERRIVWPDTKNLAEVLLFDETFPSCCHRMLAVSVHHAGAT